MLPRSWLGQRMQFDRLKRREFITLLGGAAAAWPLAAHAQQPGKLQTIGFSGQSTRSAESELVAAFTQRLRELGWIEGRTITIEYRWSEGRAERFAQIATEFVRLKVDVIVTSGTPQVLATKQATSVIPIVFARAGDPVASGLVASLARPGGNVTGLSVQSADLAGKRLELLREVVPSLRRVAILANVANPFSVMELSEAQAATRTFGLEFDALEIRRAEDIVPAFEALKGRAEALYVCPDGLVDANKIRINTSALGARLPTMHGFREYVEAGGLMSYGANLPDLYRRSADYVDKILRGAKPGDIPVEQPTKFDFIINLTTAKALGLEIPHTLIARANETIE
jgi:putative ABC transport system substrate-binding protein